MATWARKRRKKTRAEPRLIKGVGGHIAGKWPFAGNMFSFCIALYKQQSLEHFLHICDIYKCICHWKSVYEEACIFPVYSCNVSRVPRLASCLVLLHTSLTSSCGISTFPLDDTAYMRSPSDHLPFSAACVLNSCHHSSTLPIAKHCCPKWLMPVRLILIPGLNYFLLLSFVLWVSEADFWCTFPNDDMCSLVCLQMRRHVSVYQLKVGWASIECHHFISWSSMDARVNNDGRRRSSPFPSTHCKSKPPSSHSYVVA